MRDTHSHLIGGIMDIRICSQSAVVASKAPVAFASRRLIAALALPALALSGCYFMPVGQDAAGNSYYAYSPVPIPPVVPARSGTNGSQPSAAPGGPQALHLAVKLYPINDLANQTGVLTGEVTNMMNGKGRFSFSYQGETLV